MNGLVNSGAKSERTKQISNEERRTVYSHYVGILLIWLHMTKSDTVKYRITTNEGNGILNVLATNVCYFRNALI